MLTDKRLVDKYNESGPRYTSYPPATFFNEYFGEKEYLDAVEKSNSERPENISVYIHVPFCPQICHFCGCTTETGFSRPFLERYIDAVVKEIQLVSSNLDTKLEKKLSDDSRSSSSLEIFFSFRNFSYFSRIIEGSRS